jgi:hypothetical protein
MKHLIDGLTESSGNYAQLGSMFYGTIQDFMKKLASEMKDFKATSWTVVVKTRSVEARRQTVFWFGTMDDGSDVQINVSLSKVDFGKSFLFDVMAIANNKAAKAAGWDKEWTIKLGWDNCQPGSITSDISKTIASTKSIDFDGRD